MKTHNSPRSGPRERLIKVASKLFYRQGYQATGITQLIEDANIAKASFYDHFPDKESLYCAFLDEQCHTWISALKSKIGNGVATKRKIQDLFKFIEEWMRLDNYRGCPFINSTSEFPDPRSSVRISVTKAKNELRSVIESVLLEGKPSTGGSKRDLANQLYVLVEGAIVASQIHREAWPIKNAALVAERLMRG